MVDENRDQPDPRDRTLIRSAVPEDAAGIARVHVDSWETTYRGILPDTVLDARSYDVLGARWKRMLHVPEPDTIVVVAEAGGEIVGFASGGPERSGDSDYDGELYAIYLLQDRHARGTGRALTRAVAAHLLQHGKTSMLVWVLSANPSRAFYGRLGGTPVRTSHLSFGDSEYEETGYGWPDIRALLAQS